MSITIINTSIVAESPNSGEQEVSLLEKTQPTPILAENTPESTDHYGLCPHVAYPEHTCGAWLCEMLYGLGV